MMRTNNVIWILIFVLCYSCNPEVENFPPEPSIEIKKITITDQTDILDQPVRHVKLHLYLIDGDGNIGKISDSLYQRNCFVCLNYKQNGDWLKYKSQAIDTIISANNDTILFDVLSWYNIPSPGELGQNKALKADVYIDIDYPFIPGFPPNEQPFSYDTIFYQAQVYDLDLNKSNMAYSDTIIIPNK